MKEKAERISYAADFASFILEDADLLGKIKSIILFGSTARGDFDKESDIDIFIEVFRNEDEKEIDDKVKNLHKLFLKSKIHEPWDIKGIKYSISIIAGLLDNWKLKSSIYSDGIVLYGKYVPEKGNLKGFMLFTCSAGKRKLKNKVGVWRQLYGYTYKKKPKIYKYPGLIEKLNGKKITLGVFVIPAEFGHEMIKNLNKMGLAYKIYEIWSEKPI